MPHAATSRSAAEILRDARSMVGLTQAEVAQRAGVTQQMVGCYEAGRRQPSVPTLTQLVAGCGLRLDWRLVPEPGLADEPTLDQLAKPPFDRLDPAHAVALAHLAQANLDRLSTYLERAGVEYISVLGYHRSVVATRELLTDGWQLAAPGADLLVRSVSWFDDRLKRAVSVPVPGSPRNLAVAQPDDCILWWGNRDLDHLALQRAVRLANETEGGGHDHPHSGHHHPYKQ